MIAMLRKIAAEWKRNCIFRTSVKRLLWGFLAPVAVLLIAGRMVSIGRGTEWKETAGVLINCDMHGPFTDARAEVVGYGLQDPRGIVWDKDRKRIYVADGGRQDLLMFTPDRGMQRFLQDTVPCPNGNCEDLDPRGLVVDQGMILVAEHQRARIDRRPSDGGRRHDPIVAGLSAPVGIAAGPDEWLVSDERPMPMFSGLYRIGKAAGAEAEAIETGLRHPTGIAIAEGTPPVLYLAESTEVETKWLIFERDAASNTWKHKGVLALEKNDSGDVPAYQGVAAGFGKIYAAGPHGVYVFKPDGSGLGHIQFDEPVRGVALGERADGKAVLYFTAGHRLCSIGVR